MKTNGIDRLTALAFLTCSLWSGAATAAPTPTVDQIRRAITEQREAVRSMRGVYTTSTTPDAMASKSSKMRGYSKAIRIKFAWSGPKRMVELEGDWVTADMEHANVASINVFNGQEFRRRTGKDFLIQKGKSSFSEINPYLYDLRWPISDADLADVRADVSKTAFLPYCLESGDWQVRRESETVGDVRCVVLERKNMGWRLFLDPGRRYALVRAEYQNPAKGYTRSVYSCGHYREIAPGLHFPMEITTEVATEKDGKSTGTLATRVTVEDLHVNDVGDSRFVLEPNPGDYVIDRIRNQIYNYTVKDDNTLDVVSEKAALQIHQTRLSGVRKTLMFGLLGLAAGLSFVLLRANLGRHFPK